MESDRKMCGRTNVKNQYQSCTLHKDLLATGYIGPSGRSLVYTYSCTPGILCSIHACTKNWVFYFVWILYRSWRIRHVFSTGCCVAWTVLLYLRSTVVLPHIHLHLTVWLNFLYSHFYLMFFIFCFFYIYILTYTSLRQHIYILIYILYM
jgi:hypothetical protein